MSSEQITDLEGSVDSLQDGNKKSSAQEIQLLATTQTVTDAMSESNMAPRSVGQGKKRSLSLSPQVPKNNRKNEPIGPETSVSPTPVQISKRRFISTHISDFFTIKEKTGNDPVKGHAHTGHDATEKQSRTKSNMAAPMLPSMADINKANNAIAKSIKDNKVINNSEEVISTTEGLSHIQSNTDTPVLPAEADAININDNGGVGVGMGGVYVNPSKPAAASNVLTIGQTPSPARPSVLIKPLNDVRKLRSHHQPTVNRKDFSVCCSTCCNPKQTSSSKPKPISTSQPAGSTSQPSSSNQSSSNQTSSSKPKPATSQSGSTSQTSSSNQASSSKLKPNATSQPSGSTSKPTSQPSNTTSQPLESGFPHLGQPPRSSKNQKPAKPAPRGRGRPRKIQQITSPSPPRSASATNSPSFKPLPNPDSNPILNVMSPPKNVNPIAVSTDQPINAHPHLPSNIQPSPDLHKENPQQKNIYDLLLEIKSKQENSDVNKMKDLKSSLGVEINNIKYNAENDSKLVSDINVALLSTDEKVSTLTNKASVVESKLSQHNHCIHKIDDKLVTLEDKSEVLEEELLKLKCTSDQSNVALTDMVTNVEHELVSHLETIKLNIEKEISSSKENQIHVENRLTEFTKEIDSQTVEMNHKIQELKSDFENLKAFSNKNTTNPPNPPTPNQATSSSSNSSYASHQPDQTDPPPFTCMATLPVPLSLMG